MRRVVQAGVVGTAAVMATWALAATGTTTAISLPPAPVSGDFASHTPSVSDDGRFVAFQTSVSSFVSGDTNDTTDVVVYDRTMLRYERVSIRPDGSQAEAASFQASISGDARYVAFATHDTMGDASSLGQGIYVRDRVTGAVERISRGLGGAAPDNISSSPSISDDGRFVAFQSLARNLVPVPVFGDNTYVFDRLTQTTTLVSRRLSGEGAGSEASRISGDGRWISFTSTSGDLVPGDIQDVGHAYLFDRETGSIQKLDVANGIEGDAAVSVGFAPAMSRDGRMVAFGSLAHNLAVDSDNDCPDFGNDCSDVFVRDRLTGVTTIVTPTLAEVTAIGVGPPVRSAFGPELSADGRQLLIRWFQVGDVVLRRDLTTGALTREFSQQQAGVGIWTTVDLSGDGSVMVFDSNLPDLDPLDTNRCGPQPAPPTPPVSCWDVFVHLPFGASSGGGGSAGGSTGGGGGGGSNLPDIELRLAADRATVAPGGEIEVRASMRLINPANTSGAGDLVLTVVLPQGLELVSATQNRGAGCTTGGAAITCLLDFIAGDIVPVVTLVLRASSSSALRIEANARTFETDADPTNNVAALTLNEPVTVLTPPVMNRTPSTASGLRRVGTHRADILRGSALPDIIDGRRGDDRIWGYAGGDLLIGGLGLDTIHAGRGDDTVRVRDGRKDVVRCGPGADTVTADRIDVVTDCERVARV